MNNKIVLGILISFILSFDASAASDDYKCYVEYVGGGDGLQFIQAKETEVADLAKFLKQSEVSVVGRGKKAWIDKVHECVKENQIFKLGRAQLLDRITPR